MEGDSVRATASPQPALAFGRAALRRLAGFAASIGRKVKLRVLSLFAGIGGFDLGLERTGGFETVAFCEIDKKAQRVLARHWPGVPIYDDVRQVTKERLAAAGITADFITAGFPCQDISYAGKGAGLSGERSGLFYEVARIIGELEPDGVLLENVAALLARGLGDVLGTLASLGYDAEWHCIPASAVGAPHRRDRIWIMAHPAGERRREAGQHREQSPKRFAGRSDSLANADFPRLEGWLRKELQERARQRIAWQGGASVADAALNGRHKGPADCRGRCQRGCARKGAGPSCGRWWLVEPALGRVANDVPGRVDSLKQLGNAVVPLVPEVVGGAWLKAIGDRSPSGPGRATGPVHESPGAKQSPYSSCRTPPSIGGILHE